MTTDTKTPVVSRVRTDEYRYCVECEYLCWYEVLKTKWLPVQNLPWWLSWVLGWLAFPASWVSRDSVSVSATVWSKTPYVTGAVGRAVDDRVKERLLAKCPEFIRDATTDNGGEYLMQPVNIRVVDSGVATRKLSRADW